MELFARASSLDDARAMLQMDYTYQITGDPNKRASRKMLGTMTAEILESMADELIRAGIQSWIEYEHQREGGAQGPPVPQEVEAAASNAAS
jgi:hypothetical protein